MRVETIPKDATHVCDFYGKINYYRKRTSELPMKILEGTYIDTRWWYWEDGKWEDVGDGFSSRRINSITEQ